MTRESVPLNLKNIVINSAIGYGGSLSMLGLGVLIKMLLARLLNPSDFGLLITAQVIIGLATFLASLGLSESVVRFVGLYANNDLAKAKGVIWKAVGVSLKFSIITVTILCITSKFIAKDIYNEEALVGVLLILAVSIPFKVIVDILVAAYQGIGQLWAKVTFADLIPAISVAILLFIIKLFGVYSLLTITGVYLISAILPILFIARSITNNKPWGIKLSNITSKELLNYSLPLLGAGIVAWPITIIPLAIGKLTSLELVAFYSLSISLSSFIYIGVSSAEAASLPVWSSHFRLDKLDILNDDYRFVTRWGFLLSTLAFVPLFLCPEEVLSLFYGQDYIKAANFLRTISAIFLINAITGPNESILKALGCTRWIFITRLSVGSVVLLIVYPLTKTLGVNGAIIVYSVSVIVGIIMYSWHLFKRYGIHPFNYSFVKVFFSCSIAFFGTCVIQDLTFFKNIGLIKILQTILIYFIFLLILLRGLDCFTPKEISIMTNFIKKINFFDKQTI